MNGSWINLVLDREWQEQVIPGHIACNPVELVRMLPGDVTASRAIIKVHLGFAVSMARLRFTHIRRVPGMVSMVNKNCIGSLT